LDDLLEDGAINYYDQNDLQLLGNDMDSEGSGYVYLAEFIDVLFRREQGYIMSLNQRGKRQYTQCGKAPMDFTFEELEEAFKVFDVAQRGVFGKKEIRAVLKAVDDTDVSDFDACKMIEGASLTPGKDTITFEEFEAILCWSPPVEHADGNTAVEPRDPPYLHE
jgi:Ca2+-binding EF-hand superfamily protein